MPIDFSSDLSPSFRDLTHTGFVLLSRPLVRSLEKVARLRNGKPAAQKPASARIVRVSRRGSLAPF